jgi:hypothetical protein
MNKKLQDIVYFFCKYYPKELTRTILVKLVYLADVEYYKKYFRQTTDLVYEFGNHGPFTWDIINSAERLQPDFIEVQETENPYGEKKYIYRYKSNDYKFTDLDDYTSEILKLVIEKYSSLFLEDLLDYVYTNPPLVFFKKGDIIDFSKWIPSDALHLHARIKINQRMNELVSSLRNQYKGKVEEFTKEDLEDEEKDEINRIIADDIPRIIDSEKI